MNLYLLSSILLCFIFMLFSIIAMLYSLIRLKNHVRDITDILLKVVDDISKKGN